MKKFTLKDKDGMTIIELMVSMGVFSVVMTLSVGFLISLQGMQVVYRDAANLQQEGRVVSEVFARYTREAEQVVIVESNPDGSICSDADAAYAGYSGTFREYVAIKKRLSDTSVLIFACYQDDINSNRYLSMGTMDVTSGTNLSTLALPDMPFISSGQVTIKNFTYSKNDPPTYPKTLMYDIEVNRFNDWGYTGSNPVGAGEILHFPGYLVMRNER